MRAWIRRLAPLADPALALVVILVSLQPLFGSNHPVPAWGFVLVVAQGVPLAVRRRWPFAVALLCGATTVVYGMSSLPDPPVPFAGLLSLYTVAAHGSRDHANAAGVTAAFALTMALIFDPAADLQDATVQYLIFATAWLLGDSTRRRRAASAVLADRAEQLERTRAAEAAAAVAAERSRIARELHDVVAHHLSMMVVQAEGGAVIAGRDPGKAETTFDAIGAAGKQALTEMRRLLGVLKQEGPAELAPQPGPGEIPALIDGVRAAGLEVRFTETGEQPAVSDAVGLTAYRLVQEALTNCLRHSGATAVEVTIDYAAETITLAITDDGHAKAPAPALTDSRKVAADGGSGPPAVSVKEGGHGLVAMRERVALVGGTLDAGPAPDRGWAVRATLPLGGDR